MELEAAGQNPDLPLDRCATIRVWNLSGRGSIHIKDVLSIFFDSRRENYSIPGIPLIGAVA